MPRLRAPPTRFIAPEVGARCVGGLATTRGSWSPYSARTNVHLPPAPQLLATSIECVGERRERDR
jgi:hypothetical protein